MYRKIGLVICLIVLMFSVSSCAESKKAVSEIEKLETNFSFPIAEDGNRTIKEASDEVYAQQVSLCEAYVDTYEITDVGKFSKEYPEVSTSKLMEALNNRRNELNEEIAAVFFANMETIMSDVVDCENKEKYINKCFDDARLFFNDYKKITTATHVDFVKVNNVLVNNSKTDNEFARRVLNEHKDFIMDMAVRDIEYNAKTEESFRANITKNNDTIDAINGIYGGLGDNEDYRKRIDNASMTLLVKLLNSVETMTDEERMAVIAQLEEMQAAEEE